jgi:proteasome lid subunit RPN8/RPN11
MIRIPQAIHDDLIAHAQEGLPLEVCGILGITGESVSAMYRMTNTDASHEHFMMDPKVQFAVVKELRAKGLTSWPSITYTRKPLPVPRKRISCLR